MYTKVENNLEVFIIHDWSQITSQIAINMFCTAQRDEGELLQLTIMC